MIINEILKDYKVILASQSPRRQYLLKELGIDFEIISNSEIDEVFPPELTKEEIPVYLAEMKAGSVMPSVPDKTLLITADTIVWLNNKVINKPSGFDDALKMLEELSGEVHEVITGVCLRTQKKKYSFYTSTLVYFAALSKEEIRFYVEQYRPYDKAGAYGIQEWIGYIGIERIEGSYFNVMGLPVQELYREIIKFLS
jgi:septum formation protein